MGISDPVPGLELANSTHPATLYLEEGEVLSDASDPPAFPSYPSQMDRPADPSLPAGMPTCPKADRRHPGGPIPLPGTPQDRFAATLGPPPTANKTPIDTSTGQPTRVMDNSISYQAVQKGPSSQKALNLNHMSFDISKQGSNSLKGSGRGPQRPLPGSPATQWLSYECQRRHFNPDIHVVQLADGTFNCSIVIQGQVVSSGMAFADAHVARIHTASKAHKIVQKWPVLAFPANISVAHPQKTAGIKTMAMGVDRDRHDHVRRQQELRAQLLKNKQAKDGEQRSQRQEVGSQPISAGLPSSEVDMTNPVEARAFVEGYKMGQQAAMRDAQVAAEGLASPLMAKRSFTASRSRSLSRSTKGDRSYRHRSPPPTSSRLYIKHENGSSSPRYYDGSRHDPSLPSTDRYRPLHSNDCRLN